MVAVVGGASLGLLLLRDRPPRPAEALQVASTAPGQRSVILLSDGTRVMLGAASTLRYPSAFAGVSREVSLEGEAYFDVVHEGGQPFVVRAGDLVATDLGTEFTVRAYSEDAGARVVVREGRVAIRAAGETRSHERVVAPGQLGRLSGSGEPLVEQADSTAWFAWMQGRLVFVDTPLREAVRQIERWRDVEIRLVSPDLGARRFTTSFETESTPTILQVIGTGLRLEVTQTGPRSYTLRAK